MKKDLRALLAAALARGWRVDLTNGNHWRLRHPAGATVVTASTPSDWRELRNTQARMRRAERQNPSPTAG